MTSEEQSLDPAHFARRRLSFGERASSYHRFRPTYPQAAIEWALETAPLRVAELGAGTGLMTQVLLGAGHSVTAIEPDPGMASQLQQLTEGNAPLDILVGSAEAIPLADHSVQAVVSAQSFHWFDLDRAVPQMARVLEPGGVLAVVWNIRDDDVDWVEQMSRIVGRLDARSGSRDDDVPQVEPTFAPLESAEFRHEQTLTPGTLVELVDTFSYVATSPDRAAILDQIRTLAASHPQLAGRETFVLPYLTRVYRTHVATLRS